ncbi:arabinofuranosidase catalytic domain-containing protein, partial [Microbispora bryophytorum]
MHLSTLFAPGRVVRRPSSPARVAGRMVAMLATVAATALTWSAAPSQAATSQPCDIYAAGGTPCVAAHSTTRALYGNYNGSLYQVRRSSDNATRDIGV